jgi:CheY-like chemotaxis protein
VKRLVERHGGSVSAASGGPGLGSEFAVRLPAVTGAGAPPPATAAKPLFAGAARPRRVLVVEDNADARESLGLLLRLSGHEVETSVDAPDGLAKLASFRPDVMLIDVGLPGMNGYDLARRVRARPEARDVGLIALTGYGQEEDRRQAFAAGFDVHLTKPVDPERLERILARGAEG